MIKFFIPVLFVLLLLPFSVSATTYYVSKSGCSDSGPGSQAQPWCTIQKAANTMIAGDMVIVSTGNYSERVTVNTHGNSGSMIGYEANGNVKLQGFTVNANYIRIKGFEVTATQCTWNDPAYGIAVNGDYCIIEDNYAYYSPRAGIILRGTADNCIVRNNRANRNGMAGIIVHGTNNLIENNDIWGTIAHHTPTGCSNDADGLRFFGTGHVIRGNYIHDISINDPENQGYGPHIDCFQTWQNSEEYPGAYNTIIEKNYCKNNNLMMYGAMIEGSSNLTFKNNIFEGYAGPNVNTDNGPNSHLTFINNQFICNISLLNCNVGSNCWPTGLVLMDAPNCVIKNNIFYDYRSRAYAISGTSYTGLDLDYNLVYRSDGVTPSGTPNPHDLWGIDPKLVDPDNADYHLQSDSPCIDNGTTLAEVTDDYDGNSRPQGSGYDIGAFEYQEPTNVYYVSTTGNDSNPGTQTLPWRTISKVNSQTFSPGDQILFKRGETWREQLNIPSSGASGNPIVFGAYGTGNKPKILGSTALTGTWDQNPIDGTPLPTGCWKIVSTTAPAGDGMVWFKAASDGWWHWGHKETVMSNCNAEYDFYWHPSGYLVVYSPTSPGTRYTNVEKTSRANGIDGNSRNYITLQDLEIQFAYQQGIGRSISSPEGTGWIVQRNDVSYIGTLTGGWEDGIALRTSNTLIANNKVHSTCSHGIYVVVDDYDTVQNVIIENNEVYNTVHTLIDIMAIKGTLKNITVRYNKLYTTQDDNHPPTHDAWTYEPMFIYISGFSGVSDARDFYVYYNLLYNVHLFGISCQRTVDNVEIYHNTIYGHNDGSMESYGIFLDGDAVTNVKIKNNIIAHQHSNLMYVHDRSWITACDYNIWYMADGFWIVAIPDYYGAGDFSSYKTDTGWDAHGKWEDPKLLNPSNFDFHLQSTSPEIDAGINVALTRDYEGNSVPLGAAPDIGAFEFTGTLPPPPLSDLSWEAEDGVISSPFVISSGYIYQPVEVSDPASGGRASYTFDIDTEGSYIIKTVVNAPDTGANSFFLNIDSEPTSPTMIWDIVSLTSGFENRTVSWRGSGTPESNEFDPKVFALAAGQHELIIRGREANTLLDKIILQRYGSAGPADLDGDGDVDILDLSFVADHFGQTNTHPEWNATADVSTNNEIDIFDVVFVASRFT